MHEQIQGIIPPMVTPFRDDGSIDETALRAETRYLIETAGAHRLAVSGSTGEGHTLSTEEIRLITAAVVEEAAGRVPVITGIIVNSTATVIERGKAVKDLGVAALQVTPVHYLFRPVDDAMVRHFAETADAAELPVMIYNVVPWTYLSPQLLTRIIDDVPGVIGVKQSEGDVKLLTDLLLMAGDRARTMTAVDVLLYPSFALGAVGSIPAILTAATTLCVRLWNAVHAATTLKVASCTRSCYRFGTRSSPTTCRPTLATAWNCRAGMEEFLVHRCRQRRTRRKAQSMKRWRRLGCCEN